MMRRALVLALFGLFLLAPAFAQTPRLELVSGWTGPLDFRLRADGDPVDLSGMTVELILTKPDGTTTVDTTGNTSILLASDGQVRYDPDAADLDWTDSPLTMRWKVTDSSSKVVYFPSGRPGVIVIRKP